MKKQLLGLLAGAALAFQVFAADTVLRPDHPDEYVVQQGDTLWDISGRFLEKPWLWPEVWHANPQIANPHLIYPGDRLTLIYVDGKARLMLNRGGTVKLSPEIRSTPVSSAIPTIPLEDINAFLSRSRVVEGDELETAPYVLAGQDGRLIAGAGDEVHARGTFPEGEKNFGIYRAGQVFKDPVTGEVLGKEATDIGSVRLREVEGEIGTLMVNRTRREINGADRLLPAVEQKLMATFFPSAPESDVDGVILAVEDGVSQVGFLDVVILNRGAREGLKEGNVLAIYQVGATIKDPVTEKPVQLPDTRAGLLMIFRTFEKLSYGVVLSATKPLEVMDRVTNP